MSYVTWIKNCFIKKRCICWLREGGTWNSFYICKRTLLGLSSICLKNNFKKFDAWAQSWKERDKSKFYLLYSTLLFAFPISLTRIWFCHNFLLNQDKHDFKHKMLFKLQCSAQAHMYMHICVCVLCVTIAWPASLLLVIPLCCGGWRKIPWLPSGCPLKVGSAVGGGKGWHCQNQCIGLPLLGSAPVPGCVGILRAGISLQHLCGCAASECPGVAGGRESAPLFRAAGGWLRSNLVGDGVDPVVGILLV